MSLAKVEKAVEEFLSSDSPEVLSIKGGWGVGKTFFWDSFVKLASRNPKYNFERYAYVSLFGISSLDELKFAIFEQTVNKSQIGECISIDNLRQNAVDLAKGLGRKVSWLLQTITSPWLKNIGPVIHSAAFLSIKDMLICLDDFERKGDNLFAKDILGIVSLLKYQRKCKVVLIFNDSKLEEIEQKDYQQFREKVIDVEVIFNPDAKEAARFAFPDKLGIHNQLVDFSMQLGINNIRILKKIERATKSVEKLLRNFETEVLKQAIQTLTLLGWCYYSKEKGVPSYEYVKRRHEIDMLTGNDKDPEKQRWQAILRNYGFGYIDEFDLALSNIIENGYVDEETLIEGAKKINAQIIVRKSQDSYNQAWELFHNTFADNEGELVIALKEGLKENAEYISPNNLHSTVHLLRALGYNALASELIDVYIEQNKGKPKLFDLDNYSFSNDIKDKELISKFTSTFNQMKKIRTLEDVLQHIAGKDSWGRSDEEVLFTASEHDFYKIFTTKDGGHLRSYVDACLQFGRFSNPTEQQRAIAEKAKKALIRIGKENKLNRIRVEILGISIEDDDTGL